MKVGSRKLGLTLGAVVMLALLPVRAEGQTGPYSPMFWSFEGSVGMVLPMGDIADAAESGPAFTAAASYFMSPRLALRAEGGLDMLGTKGSVDPNFQILHLLGGIEYHLVDPMGNTTVAVDVLAGASTFDTDVIRVHDHPSSGDFTVGLVNGSYVSGNAGIKVGYNFARHADSGVPMVTLFAHAKVRMIWADADNTHVYMALNGLDGFDTVMEIPFSVGLRINFP
ncbi:hypothetical protein [Candidatus Palauibacter sp.]|uniref:hypothetical protein n=1 Tax=Candidatus Palauibacter sp. TaxID=3101350 RepID=UPI003B019DD7